ncbi:hypothetical protein D3C72_2539400 [compost metagenome]
MRHLHQLVNTRAMRKRGNDDGGVARSGAGHQIAEMVGDDESHLAMGEHRRLGAAGGA